MEKTISLGSIGCNIINLLLIALSVAFALNFVYGIGKITKSNTKFQFSNPKKKMFSEKSKQTCAQLCFDTT